MSKPEATGPSRSGVGGTRGAFTLRSPKDARPVEEPWDGRRPRRGATVLVLCACLAALVLGAGLLVTWVQTERGREEVSRARLVAGNETPIAHNGHTYVLNEDLVRIAFIGFDGRYQQEGAAGQADVVMVVAIDVRDGKVSGVVIPRDSMVSVDAYSGGAFAGRVTQQIALQYAYGDGSEQSSALVAQAASRVLNDLPIDYYLTLNLYGVASLNDAVGGVSLEPVASVPGTDIVAGEQIRLEGEDAYQYIHWRQVEGAGSLDSSIERQRRQVQYLNAFMAQAMRAAGEDAALLDRLYQTALENGWSDLGAEEYAYLARAMLTSGVSGVDVRQLSGQMRAGALYSEYYLDEEAALECVLDVFYRQVG